MSTINIYNMRMQIRIGGHLSIGGGHKNALIKIQEIGGNTLQIFSTSPRGWNKANLPQTVITEFLNLKSKLKIDPIYFHASYLINLANGSSGGHLSKESLIHELNLAPKFGVKGTIVHLGSFKDNDGENIHQDHNILIKNIKDVLENTPEETLFMIENSGNKKIGRRLEQIAHIINDIDDTRVRVCLDTCHLHSAGYNLTTQAKLDEFLTLFDRIIGLHKLELWHLNDSRDTFGSLRDRHENIGEGNIGKETFRLIINHPKLKHLPFIIETPGFDGNGPDKKNLDILKALIA